MLKAKNRGEFYGFISTKIIVFVFIFVGKHILSAFNGECEAVIRTADQKYDGPTNAWVVRCLS